MYGQNTTNPSFAQQPTYGLLKWSFSAIYHTILHTMLERWAFSREIGVVKGFENEYTFPDIQFQPGGYTIARLLEGRPWCSLVEDYLYSSCVLGAHDWWCENGFIEATLISVFRDLQYSEIALILVIAVIDCQIKDLWSLNRESLIAGSGFIDHRFGRVLAVA